MFFITICYNIKLQLSIITKGNIWRYSKLKTTYRDPRTLTKVFISSIYSRLHQKWRRAKHFIFSFWIELVLYSEHLWFLSFQTVHQMQAGLPSSFCSERMLYLFQHSNPPSVTLGITHTYKSKLVLSLLMCP